MRTPVSLDSEDSLGDEDFCTSKVAIVRHSPQPAMRLNISGSTQPCCRHPGCAQADRRAIVLKELVQEQLHVDGHESADAALPVNDATSAL
jgi:hypothetical protein